MTQDVQLADVIPVKPWKLGNARNGGASRWDDKASTEKTEALRGRWKILNCELPVNVTLALNYRSVAWTLITDGWAAGDFRCTARSAAGELTSDIKMVYFAG